MSKVNLFILSGVMLSMSAMCQASADDVKCDIAADQLVTHFDKDFKKVFTKESKAKEMRPFFYEMCEAGKVDANTQFRSGKYNITSAAMGVDLQSAMKMREVDDNYKPIVTQYASVAYMYGYVNWFVN